MWRTFFANWLWNGKSLSCVWPPALTFLRVFQLLFFCQISLSPFTGAKCSSTTTKLKGFGVWRKFFCETCGKTKNRLHVSRHLHWRFLECFGSLLWLLTLFSLQLEPSAGLQHFCCGVLAYEELFLRPGGETGNRLHFSSHLLWRFRESSSCSLSIISFFPHSLAPNAGLQQSWKRLACEESFLHNL